jgi:outer membrane protein OmpA-like peptidoglycan-associated protein
MNTKNILKIGSHAVWSNNFPRIKSLLLVVLILTGTQFAMQAQDKSSAANKQDSIIQPSWWFGVAGGANVNFYDGSTQQLNSEMSVPKTFHEGFGVGLYLAPVLEYHRPESLLGFMLQAGYDSRKGAFDEVKTPCNCPADLKTDLSYITIEPSLRIAPFKSDFYIYVGPRFAYNYAKGFTYKQGTNPDYPDQLETADVEGDFSDIENMLISMQVGAGYDFHLTKPEKRMQTVLSPFVSFQPYFGQEPRSIETWNITTVRVGAALKFGRARIVEPKEEVVHEVIPMAAVVAPEIVFTVISPANVAVDRRVRETFPISNYVFFNLKSTDIPDRYVLLSKDQVKDFKEDRLEVFKPKKLSGRSDREMTVYYNVLNILGDRMTQNPNSKINLKGSSRQGVADAKAMAESVKKYLVTVFGIKESRITTEGNLKPTLPSEQAGGTKELTQLREEDRRVTISSASPEIMMEYQTGPNVRLKPVEFEIVQQAPLDSYINFNVSDPFNALKSWSIEVKDKRAIVQKFGPYTLDNVSIPGKTILGNNPEGKYLVSMVGKAKNGTTVIKDTTLMMVLWTPTENEMGMRFNVIYEFNNSDAIKIYEKYLVEVVVPQIPKNGKVIIHGHTDAIGDAANNKKLSQERANDVYQILKNSLAKKGRSDVTFQVIGFGEDENQSLFENNYPEERFYNRTVTIDIVPKK